MFVFREWRVGVLGHEVGKAEFEVFEDRKLEFSQDCGHRLFRKQNCSGHKAPNYYIAKVVHLAYLESFSVILVSVQKGVLSDAFQPVSGILH